MSMWKKVRYMWRIIRRRPRGYNTGYADGYADGHDDGSAAVKIGYNMAMAEEYGEPRAFADGSADY